MSVPEIFHLFKTPLEIFDKIVREAASTDRATVLSMLQTHPSFVCYGREFVWNEVDISSAAGRKADDFLELLSVTGQANIPSYVKKLHIKTTSAVNNDPDEFRRSLAMFDGVVTLYLDCVPLAYLRGATDAVARLQTIDLVRCPFRYQSLHDMLESAMSLGRLYVEDCRYDQNSMWESPQPPPAHHLAFRSSMFEFYLSFGQSCWPNSFKLNTNWLFGRLMRGAFCSLSRLTLDLDGIHISDTNDVLRVGGKQLVRFSCIMNDKSVTSPTFLDMSTLSNVTEVTFEVAYIHIPWLCTSVQTIPHTAPLRSIHIPILYDRRLYVPLAWWDMDYCLDRFVMSPSLHIGFLKVKTGDIFSLSVVLYMTRFVFRAHLDRVTVIPSTGPSMKTWIQLQVSLVNTGVAAGILQFHEYSLVGNQVSDVPIVRLIPRDEAITLED
ncbi:uncharacterized protein ARMOST_04509 [Armillaria ostoyae]|uniref:Uncharacterized protein n=1 Tax=Armillaria ostoyae TaxID=47428 RepID=A0A284QXI9_ARMOS|nr:uncharacterized protein ARMOST_04509 [Armillaria ostoyae]